MIPRQVTARLLLALPALVVAYAVVMGAYGLAVATDDGGGALILSRVAAALLILLVIDVLLLVGCLGVCALQVPPAAGRQEEAQETRSDS